MEKIVRSWITEDFDARLLASPSVPQGPGRQRSVRSLQPNLARQLSCQTINCGLIENKKWR